MFTHVRHTIVGTKVTTAATVNEAVNGDIVLVDDKNNIITAASGLDNANSIKIGVVHGTTQIADPNNPGDLLTVPNIEWGMPIQKGVAGIATSGLYTAATEQTYAFNAAGVTFTAGMPRDFGLRILYKDVDTVASAQFTYTYYAYDITSAANLVTKFAERINKDPRSRVNATVSGTTLTLTGLPISIDNNIDEYEQVSFEASMYEIPRDITLFATPKLPVAGLTTTNTVGNPGAGSYQMVLDAERRYRGYKGHVFTGAYPEVEGKQYATEGTNYNWMTINFNNLYRSNDNQYIKDTPIGYEVYCSGTDLANITEWVNTFLA